MSDQATHALSAAGQAMLAEGQSHLKAASDLLADIKRLANPKAAHETLQRVNAMQQRLEDAYNRAQLLQSVHPDEGVRTACEQIEQEASRFMTDLGLDRELYEIVAAMETSPLDADALRLVDKMLRDFRRSGVDRGETVRNRIRELNDEITQISQEFSRNIRDDSRSIQVSPERLGGLPGDFLKSHKPGDDGQVAITTDWPDYFAVMTYAQDDALREELYRLKLKLGYPKNIAVLEKLIATRHALATLLDYPTYAHYATEEQMIKAPDTARAFIDQVAGLGRPRGERDLAALLERIRKEAPAAEAVMPWQGTYWTRVVKQERYRFDPSEVRPYFEVAKVLSGILAISSDLFGIRFTAVEDAERWHEDVQVFDVRDENGPIGRIYLDLYPRPNKYKHAAMFPMVGGLEGERLAEGAIVCNFPDPKLEKAYLEHNDVTTFFHEFGHLLHHILGGGQRWLRFSGVATEWDFVEVPSQLFEEWAWDADMLRRFAVNEAGEAIPADLVERMRAADEFGTGAFVMQQMAYAAISLGLYDRDPAALDLDGFISAQFAAYSLYPRLPDTHFECGFGHLVEYASNYYTYMWSLVIVKDLYDVFKTAGLADTSVTRAYRDKILKPGGSRDAAQLVSDFLGRDFSFKAFERWLLKEG
jgi:thimet oligopeptidase